MPVPDVISRMQTSPTPAIRETARIGRRATRCQGVERDVDALIIATCYIRLTPTQEILPHAIVQRSVVNQRSRHVRIVVGCPSHCS